MTRTGWLFLRGCPATASTPSPWLTVQRFCSTRLQDISLTTVCACVWSSWSPASTICQTSSTVCYACSPQHLRKPCFSVWNSLPDDSCTELGNTSITGHFRALALLELLMLSSAVNRHLLTYIHTYFLTYLLTYMRGNISSWFVSVDVNYDMHDDCK